jgi:hypothetical protein
MEGQLNESARRSALGKLMDRRYFSDRIKVHCGTEPNDKTRDLSRGKAEVKSMTSRKILLRNFFQPNISGGRRIQSPRGWIFSAPNRIIKVVKGRSAPNSRRPIAAEGLKR